MLKDFFRRLFRQDSRAPASAGTGAAVDGRAPAAPATGTAPDDDTKTVTFVDEFGREMQVSARVWREQVLAPNLAAQADNPDRLYNLILSAMNDGYFADVEAACARLQAIDPNVERGHVVRGIVLMKLGRLDDAEAALRDGIRRAGETASLLTNLAKVYSARGDEARADEWLERAVQCDPNMDNGLAWWLARHEEKGGEAAREAALARAAAMPGAWRPQAWQAHALCTRQRIDEAADVYRALLARPEIDSDLLLSVSGNFGNAGRLDLMLALVPPAYDPTRHDWRVGLNLLEAYRQSGMLEPGRDLLHRLYALQNPTIKRHLDHFTEAFEKMALERPLPQPEPDDIRIEIASFDRPLWQYSIGDPGWLFARKPADTATVLFYPPAIPARAEMAGGRMHEDAAGRLSRAIPLYLAESVHEWTDLRALAMFPVVRGGGVAVFGTPHDTDELIDRLGEHGRWLVTGTIEESDDGEAVVCLAILEMASRRVLADIREPIGVAEAARAGSATRRIEQWLLGHLGEARATPLDSWYARLPDDWLPNYTVALNQSLMLSLSANGLVAYDTLHGEREIHERAIALAMTHGDAGQARLLALASLAKARRSGSPLVGEYQRRLEAMVRSATPTEWQATLKPLVAYASGDNAGLESLCAAAPARDDEAYRLWLRELLSSAHGQDGKALH